MGWNCVKKCCFFPRELSFFSIQEKSKGLVPFRRRNDVKATSSSKFGWNFFRMISTKISIFFHFRFEVDSTNHFSLGKSHGRGKTHYSKAEVLVGGFHEELPIWIGLGSHHTNFLPSTWINKLPIPWTLLMSTMMVRMSVKHLQILLTFQTWRIRLIDATTIVKKTHIDVKVLLRWDSERLKLCAPTVENVNTWQHTLISVVMSHLRAGRRPMASGSLETVSKGRQPSRREVHKIGNRSRESFAKMSLLAILSKRFRFWDLEVPSM